MVVESFGGWHEVSGPNISPVLFTQIPAGPRSQQCVLTSPSSWGSSLPGFTVSVNDNDELSDQGYTSLPKSDESESGQMVLK